jgi:hypothetical protein
MNTNLLAIAAHLSDDELRAKVKLLAQQSRDATVELIAHLAELAARRLYCSEGPGSLFRYCTEILRFSEAAACNRIKTARAARKFPVILDLLADGSVNPTTIRLLAPHLTPDNHHVILAEAKGMTRRQVDKLVARLSPQPDVPPSIRKLPGASATPAASASVATNDVPEKATTPSATREGTTSVSAGSPTRAVVATEATRRPTIAPLAPERYRVQFTIGQETEEQLRRLQDLLRAEIPDGDPGAIFVRSLPLLLREVERRKFAATSKPRPGRSTKAGSRHVPAEVERTVWQRDGGRCAFVGSNGRRCGESTFLEFHHANEPYALGGEATVENIALRCRAHNVYESELIFGKYDPSHVRETPAGYGTSGDYWSRDQ